MVRERQIARKAEIDRKKARVREKEGETSQDFNSNNIIGGRILVDG